MHRCIAIIVTRYVSRYSLQQSRYPRSCNILAFLIECHTDINCQSAKNYQCRMSSHPQQTAGSSSQLKTIKLCRMSPSRHRLRLSRTWDNLNWPLERYHFLTHDQSPGAVQGPDSIHSCQCCSGLNMRQTVCNFLSLTCWTSKRGDHDIGVNHPAIVREIPHFDVFLAFPHFF